MQTQAHHYLLRTPCDDNVIPADEPEGDTTHETPLDDVAEDNTINPTEQTLMDTIPEDLPSPLSPDHLQNAKSADCTTTSAQSRNEVTTCESAASHERTDISPDQPQSNNPSTDSGHQCGTDEKGCTRISYSLRRKSRPPDRL